MKRAAGFLITLLVTGCATPNLARKPGPESPDSPEVIYAIPQSQAFAIALGAIRSAALRCGADRVHIDNISRGDGLRGYEAEYYSWIYRFYIPRRLYVVPAAGIAANGQQIDGFRFEITYYYYRGLRAVNVRLPGGGCEQTLISALLTTLQATGSATSVTSLETRPYGEGRYWSSAQFQGQP
jgi:hypothetical protein